MHRYLLWLSVTFWTDTSFAEAYTEITNSSDLRNFFLTEHNAAVISPLTAIRGCTTTNDCRVSIGDVTILRDKAVMRTSAGQPIRIVENTPGPLPEIDWDPVASYSVFNARRPWGSCLEFSHTGLGKSGRYQRWSSIILIPKHKSLRARIAYRFVGYWASCESLIAGKRSDLISLPIIESTQPGQQLRIHLHTCSSRGCATTEDTREVVQANDVLLIRPTD